MSDFCTDLPSHQNALSLFAGSWKYDFESASEAQLTARILGDGRPRFCAGQYRDFARMRILELGPSDGYNTVGLEWAGAQNITSIEASKQAYLRCLVMKNRFNLKATYLLGDFTKYLETTGDKYDLIYASGVLYHLTDPAQFIVDCTSRCDHFFIWTLLMSPEIWNHKYERTRFRREEEHKRSIAGIDVTYHRRYYEPVMVADAKYAGGIENYAHWMTLDDIQRLLAATGFKVVRSVADEANAIKAINLLCSKA